MRLTGTDDTDIALDQYGQPVVGEDGDVRLVSEEETSEVLQGDGT